MTFRLTGRPGALIVDDTGAVPAIVHWGADPGHLPDATYAALATRPAPGGATAVDRPLSLVTTGAAADDGSRGFVGLFDGDSGPTASFHHFGTGSIAEIAHGLEWTASTDTGLQLSGHVRTGEVLVLHATIRNESDRPFSLHRLAITVPLPARADELLTIGGRWTREFHTARRRIDRVAATIESRHGRTSHEQLPAAIAGTAGFGEAWGEVWGANLAWSGNHELRVERLADGRGSLRCGELLEPGEVVLEPGQSYTTPEVWLAWSDEGLNAVSQSFHRRIRAAQPERPRPVLLNTWEAVYFDHDLDRLRALADRAAAVGVERFVLDDGWFGSRRDDTSGLGDWTVSADAHPDGLEPLVQHVRALGMEFGIWVEPEMVNRDSDLYRAHPDWVLGNTDVEARHQLVLDLSIDACRSHLLDQLDALLRDHDIAFVKWDHNRAVVGAGGHGATVGFYRLLDELRARHPGVEFESCASGGGRADGGVLARTERIWTSDCNDATERQHIQRGFTHLFPLSVMGAHVGPPRAHTTGRTQRLAYRSATALFGHLGLEWNLLDADERHLDGIRAAIDLHKRLRPLLHGGDLFRLDHPDPSVVAFGVVDSQRRHAVYSYALVDPMAAHVPAPLRLAGLDDAVDYELRHLVLPGEIGGAAYTQPTWFGGLTTVTASGAALRTIGVQPPVLLPDSAVILELTAP